MKQNREKRLKELLGTLRVGRPYRTAELAEKSSNLSRDLEEMVELGWLKRPSAGVYLKPKVEWFGEVPVDKNKLLGVFLKSDDFLLVDFNKYNALGLGTTQLHNKQVVYNHKRHGVYTLDGVEYEFKRVSYVPKKLDREFLLVDMMNNLKSLGEDVEQVCDAVKRNWMNFNWERVLKLASRFGKVRTKKIFHEICEESHVFA